jgi:hypothetical protein
MVEPSKEFKNLDDAQEAIRRWCKGHPGQDVQLDSPDLVERLARAQEAHDAAKQKVMIDEAKSQ